MKGRFVWSPSEGIDVSSYGSLKVFSPFSYDSSYKIPLPGDEHRTANSVEGIWQGLKVIDGKTDEILFCRRPKKRRGKPEGHRFGKELIDYASARKEIYLPAYTFHVVHYALPGTYGTLEAMLEEGNVMLHDIETNGDINELSSPLAHSSILAELLNVLSNAPIPPFNKKKFSCLQEQVEALADNRKELNTQEADILDDVITFSYLFCPNALYQTFALRFLKETGKETDRLKRYKPSMETLEPYEACLRR